MNWKRCNIGSCHRHQECMYRPCRIPLKKAALLCATILALCAAAPPPPPQALDPLLALRGVNAGVQDALQAWPTVMQQFPGMTAIRLNCDSGKDSAGDIAKVVEEYTGAGVTVEVEDHSGNQNNIVWYQMMAGMFRNNPLVLLELPNEPNADNLVPIQIGLIRAIRGAGFNNPIGIQPMGGWGFDNVGQVLAAVGKTGLFATPHIYYGGDDPNGAVAYVDADLAQCNALGVLCVFDEFGNAMDGVTKDPQGDAVILAVLAANEGANGGKVRAGAIFWAMDNGNHPDGADSTFLTTDASQLTITGRDVIQKWLSQERPQQPPLSVMQTQQMNSLQQQIAVMQQQDGTTPPTITKIAAPMPPSAAPAPVPVAPTPPPAAPDVASLPPAMQAEITQAEAEIQQAQVEITALLAQIAAMQQTMPQAVLAPPAAVPDATDLQQQIVPQANPPTVQPVAPTDGQRDADEAVRKAQQATDEGFRNAQQQLWDMYHPPRHREHRRGGRDNDGGGS